MHRSPRGAQGSDPWMLGPDRAPRSVSLGPISHVVRAPLPACRVPDKLMCVIRYMVMTRCRGVGASHLFYAQLNAALRELVHNVLSRHFVFGALLPRLNVAVHYLRADMSSAGRVSRDRATAGATSSVHRCR
jgi:hypothetical protein